MFRFISHILTKVPTNIRYFLLYLLVAFPFYAISQEHTEYITIQKENNKGGIKEFFGGIDFAAAPIYSPYTGIGVSAIATKSYNFKKRADDTPKSTISLNGTVTSTGFVIVGVHGTNYSKKAKWQTLYNIVFHNIPTNYWGLGYYNGESGDKTTVDYTHFYGDLTFLYNITPKMQIGPTLGFDRIKSEDISTGMLNCGAIFKYDTRDFIPNPHKGVHLLFKQHTYTNLHGNTSILIDFYHKVFENTILAYDIYSEFNYGEIPWTMMAMIGGNNRMRGYYRGRYRDKNMVTAQIELRQKIWKFIGATAWAGGGNVWGIDKFKWEHTLPNYGLGLRLEVKERINLRFDYGFGKDGQNCFIFSINEAF